MTDPAKHGFEPIFHGATHATFKKPPKRLAQDIPRAIKRCGWGLRKLVELAGNKDSQNVDGSETTPDRLRITATAILPDGRNAQIAAIAINDEEFHVVIRVGYFGDASREQVFIDRLAKILRGKPKPKRGGNFSLPDPEAPRPKTVPTS